jgi:Ser/Thr protein kinase RdoA (MazF antagonist)
VIVLPIPDIAPAQLAQVIEGIYGVRTNAPPTTLPPGFHSRAWLVPTERGIWIAKLSSPASDSREKLERQARLCDYLNRQGIRAPDYLPLRDGASIAVLMIDHVGYPLQLVKYEQLQRIQPHQASNAQLAAIGEFVASLHTALDQYPERDMFVADHQKSANEWGMRTNGLWPDVAGVPDVALLSNAERAWFHAIDRETTAWLRQHNPDAATLAMAVLHGDLNFEHIRYLNDGTPYVFDFGDMCWGPVAHELAVLFLNLVLDDDLPFAEWEAMQRGILAGYTTQRSLPHRDRELIAAFLVNRVLARAEYSVELAREMQLPINWKVIRQTYEVAAYLIDRSDHS